MAMLVSVGETPAWQRYHSPFASVLLKVKPGVQRIVGWNFRSACSDRALTRPHQTYVRTAAQFACLALPLSHWVVVPGSMEDFDTEVRAQAVSQLLLSSLLQPLPLRHSCLTSTFVSVQRIHL